MRVEYTAFDHAAPNGEQFTCTWYPETDGDLACAADRARPGDRIVTTGRIFFAASGGLRGSPARSSGPAL